LRRISLGQKVLAENDRIAAKLRARFADSRLLTLNLISSPGSGKTSLLEQTLSRIADELHVAVLTGDIATGNDAARLQGFGSATQITTGGACHLDANMIQRGLENIQIDQLDVLFIENVGNLVCPAAFDIGEHAKIVVLSVTEGDDKPLKYPNIFVRSELMVLNKIDLLPYVPFDVDRVFVNAQKTHPGIEMIKTSCTTGEGFDNWISWLRSRLEAFRAGDTKRGEKNNVN
jgi:hydrogenase nickel incorporation protein HypB